MSLLKKIIFPVGALYPNESGGVSLSLYWHLKGLYSSDKFEITVITTDYGIKPQLITKDKWINTDYGKIIYLSTYNINIAFRLIVNFILKIKNNDLVHLSSIFYPPTIICFFIAKIYNKKIIWSTRGSVDDIEFLKKGSLKKITIFLLRFFVKDIFFHTTSLAESEFVKKQFGKSVNIIQIPNYIVLPKKININKDNYFLYLGRFHQKKGIFELIEALKISKLFVNSKFILKVAGNFKNDYGELILKKIKDSDLEQKISLLGSVEGNEKQLLLAKAHFLFMPSFSENFGIVTAEALAQGTPVVASKFSPWQSLEFYNAGYWINNTPEELAKYIDIIISLSNNEYLTMCKNALQLSNIELDIFTNIHQWIKVYSKCFEV